MKIDILTLFPKMFDGFLNESIIKRAIEKKIIKVNIINFRDYSPLNNHMVDDTIYGGGAGMLLRCEPIFECIDKIKTKDSHIIILSPEGKIYNQEIAKKLSENYNHLIIICGHYEGFDERIKTLADEIISVGDFILTGGEVASLILLDSITRLLPGAISKESLDSESFDNNLLDYPMYTKPREYRGLKVPDVLISGNHKKINEWRRAMQKEKTKKNRPDLME